VSVYVDASVLVPLFTDDALTVRADAYLRGRSLALIISDFAAAEFASAIARLVRVRSLEPEVARRIFANFDTWSARTAERAVTISADIIAAAAFIRRLDLPLRTPDAINIAIAQRVAADLLTFDRRMAENARALGTSVVAA
jgi:uncharacterized protein